MSIFAQMDAASPRVAPRSPVFAYRMRWKRRRLLLRAWRFRHQLQRLRVDSARIEAAPILAFSTLRNERARLPHFLDHNRALGVGHFLIVDNDSDDGTQEFLRGQADVSFWRAGGSYKQARFGVDWLTCLQFRFGHGKWCLTLDADELLVLPGGARPAAAYRPPRCHGTPGLRRADAGSVSQGPRDRGNLRARGRPARPSALVRPAGLPRATARGLRQPLDPGGPRDRVFFTDQPDRAPTLSKTPLIKWRRSFAYVTSTHQALPMHLNRVFAPGRPTGVLLHSKFLPDIAAKSAEELHRRQHFENADFYTAYHESLIAGVDLWHPDAAR
ncbi:MAG: glycosyltransferase family 2 protein [Salibaculum sp.]|uniref:glycosyltransferase family 2 protein n=1 Tax=Salibaculum sp. TaxID=2855480 RepID=UPI00286FEB67|nr:glycosyltransferase family 2 protein [Salibaculum sp.]MDR9426770.1 glycosyltransferase family 2 protein [Salibaculum sp.]